MAHVWGKYYVNTSYTNPVYGAPESFLEVIIAGQPTYYFGSSYGLLVTGDYGSFMAPESIPTGSLYYGGNTQITEMYSISVITTEYRSLYQGFKRSITCNQVTTRGSFVENVIAENPATYPTDGQKGGYWYVYVGQTSGMYIKVNGQWVLSRHPYVKVNGNWKEAQEVFIKSNGVWVRST